MPAPPARAKAYSARVFAAKTRSRFARFAALAGAGLALAGCELPTRDPAGASVQDHLAVMALLGTWRWEHVVDEPELRRLESEEWQFWPDDGRGATLLGRYRRALVVTSSGDPFLCNGAARYEQRATFELVARSQGGELEIAETGYQAQPSPCDHGFRKLGRYRVKVTRGRALLLFEDGAQVLWRVDEQVPSVPLSPWPRDGGALAGAWRWSNAALDDQGLVQEEDERWELTGDAAHLAPTSLRDGATFSASYTRRVTVRSPDGAELPCAGGSAYGFEDRYVLEGKRRDGILLLRELAVAAGQHPCLRERQTRVLDTATVEVEGEHLVLEWRGKRRQLLRRDEGPTDAKQ